MKFPVAWLREFVDVPDDPETVGRRFSACGLAVESIEGDVLDVEVTANRPDCLSVYGLAREASAVWDVELRTPGVGTPGVATPGVTTPGVATPGVTTPGVATPGVATPGVTTPGVATPGVTTPGVATPGVTTPGVATPGVATPGVAAPGVLPVTIDDADGCGRYALAIADVTVGPSPAWLASRLAACGVRPINNIVDITNYVMLEMGQPMHAFDAATLAGPQIRVRRARDGERLQTLDNLTRTLDARMLVIADRDQPIAIAGVMGGAPTEVSAQTTRVAIESAWFAPGTVRETSRRLGLKTEASARFERGSDSEAPVAALARALDLLEQTGAGRAVAAITDIRARTPDPRRVRLRRDRLARLLGVEVPSPDVERLLGRLAFALTASPDGWDVVVPSFRVDVAREADLIEEVGRHWGFDRIPARFPALTEMPRPIAPAVLQGRHLRRLLGGAGLQEAVTFTFIDARAAAPFAPDADQVAIKNPLSEKFAVMRPSLVPGLVDSLEYNRNRQAGTVRLFEIGSVFSKAGGERTCVGWVLTGPRQEHWSERAIRVDFSDTKGLAELVSSTLGATLEVTPADNRGWLTAGQRANLLAGGLPVGWIGRLAHTDSTSDPVMAGEIDLDVLTRAGASRPRAIAMLPKFPTSVRDISILIDERLPAESVRGTIRTSAPPTLVSIREFDRYQGKGVPDGQASLSIRLTFQSADRTLLDAEVQQAVDDIVAALVREHHATLRGR